jgi:hypothetical protein
MADLGGTLAHGVEALHGGHQFAGGKGLDVQPAG